MDPGTMMAMASMILPQLMNQGGSENQLKKIPTKTSGQTGMLDKSIQQWQNLAGGGYENAIGLLQGLLDPESEIYKNFEAPYLQEFYQKTIPGLSEQFAGFNGMGGALQSSGFGQAIGAGQANLATNLAQMKSQLQQQAASGILGQYNQQFNQNINPDPFAYYQQPGSQSPGQAASGQLAQGGTQYLMNKMMNPQMQNANPTQNPLTSQIDTLFRTGNMSYT
jgi:hypothetical protein